MKSTRKPKKKRSAVRIAADIVVTLIALSLFATAGWILYKQYFPNNTPILKMQVTKADKTFDWDALRKVNPEAIGWMKIDGTNIDTPVVQATDNDKYLYTSFDGGQDERGTLFLDKDYKWNPNSRNSVIYGHSNMRSGVHVMFDDLKQYYNEPNFVNEHNLINYNRPPELGGDSTWAIFSVISVEADVDYRQTDFADEESFMAYYQKIKDMSLYPTSVQVQPGDEILTLSTCIFNTGLSDGRLAVIAKKVQ